MIAIDDHRAWANYLGHHQVKTPNMDCLAAMGTAFERAYCPAPICNPSRSALITGLRPSTTGIYDNGADWRINPVAKKVPTFPLWLRKHGYLACGAFMDTQLGRLLDAFEKSDYKDNTLILPWVDHGWHHGEKHHWKKYALWEETTRVPVIRAVPGVAKPGTRCTRTVDHMGIYPTLCDAVGVPPPPHLEGKSYRALLENPDAAWEQPALTTCEAGNNAVRPEKWGCNCDW